MSIESRSIAHRAAKAAAAKAYTDAAFPGPAMATPADLQSAFLAGCEHVERERARFQILNATYADDLITVQFGDGSTLELTPQSLRLKRENIREIDAGPSFLRVHFVEPVHLAGPRYPPEQSCSYSVNYLRMAAQVTNQKDV